MIDHSLGRMEACFGPSTLGALGSDIKTHLESRFLLASHFDKRGAKEVYSTSVGAKTKFTKLLLGPNRS